MKKLMELLQAFLRVPSHVFTAASWDLVLTGSDPVPGPWHSHATLQTTSSREQGALGG